MIQQIQKIYTPEYIIDICTTRELKYLQEFDKYLCTDPSKEGFSFVRAALHKKYLIFEEEIPDEFKENIDKALKIVDLKKKEEKDKPLITLLGFIRSCSVCEPTLVHALAQGYNIDLSVLDTNLLFKFWTYITYGNDTSEPQVYYWDSYIFADAIHDKQKNFKD